MSQQPETGVYNNIPVKHMMELLFDPKVSEHFLPPDLAKPELRSGAKTDKRTEYENYELFAPMKLMKKIAALQQHDLAAGSCNQEFAHFLEDFADVLSDCQHGFLDAVEDETYTFDPQVETFTTNLAALISKSIEIAAETGSFLSADMNVDVQAANDASNKRGSQYAASPSGVIPEMQDSKIPKTGGQEPRRNAIRAAGVASGVATMAAVEKTLGPLAGLATWFMGDKEATLYGAAVAGLAIAGAGERMYRTLSKAVHGGGNRAVNHTTNIYNFFNFNGQGGNMPVLVQVAENANRQAVNDGLQNAREQIARHRDDPRVAVAIQNAWWRVFKDSAKLFAFAFLGGMAGSAGLMLTQHFLRASILYSAQVVVDANNSTMFMNAWMSPDSVDAHNWQQLWGIHGTYIAKHLPAMIRKMQAEKIPIDTSTARLDRGERWIANNANIAKAAIVFATMDCGPLLEWLLSTLAHLSDTAAPSIEATRAAAAAFTNLAAKLVAEGAAASVPKVFELTRLAAQATASATEGIALYGKDAALSIAAGVRPYGAVLHELLKFLKDRAAAQPVVCAVMALLLLDYLYGPQFAGRLFSATVRTSARAARMVAHVASESTRWTCNIMQDKIVPVGYCVLTTGMKKAADKGEDVAVCLGYLRAAIWDLETNAVIARNGGGYPSYFDHYTLLLNNAHAGSFLGYIKENILVEGVRAGVLQDGQLPEVFTDWDKDEQENRLGWKQLARKRIESAQNTYKRYTWLLNQKLLAGFPGHDTRFKTMLVNQLLVSVGHTDHQDKKAFEQTRADNTAQLIILTRTLNVYQGREPASLNNLLLFGVRHTTQFLVGGRRNAQIRSSVYSGGRSIVDEVFANLNSITLPSVRGGDLHNTRNRAVASKHWSVVDEVFVMRGMQTLPIPSGEKHARAFSNT